MRCSAQGCDREATETLFLRGQAGHVHDCTGHAAELREWCDVVDSAALVDGKCLATVCTEGGTWIGQPRPLL